MGPLVRIILRYGVGALVMWGVLSASLANDLQNDPDIKWILEITLGLVIGFLVERYYVLAKRYGWPT